MPADQTIPHEDEHRAVVDSEMQAESAALTNAVTSHTINATFSNTEVKNALDALGTKINTIIAVLKT